MDELEDLPSSGHSHEEDRVLDEVNAILANPDIAKTVTFIVDLPRSKVKDGKLIAVVNLLRDNERLDDFIISTGGKADLIRFGIENLIKIASVIQCTGHEDEYLSKDLHSFNHRAWQKAFRHIYVDIYHANNKDAHNKLIELGLPVRISKNLKAGFADYFYNLAIGEASAANAHPELDGSRVFLQAVAPLVDNLKQLQDSRRTKPALKNIIRGNMLEGALEGVKEIAKKNVSPDLVECFDDSSDTDGFSVTYKGLLRKSYSTLQHAINSNNRTANKLVTHNDVLRESMIGILRSKEDNLLLHHTAALLNQNDIKLE